MALHNLYRTPQWLRPGSGISFVFRGSDEAMEIATSAGGAVTRPQDFEATAGTGADDTVSLNSWIAETGLKYLPNGDYLASGSVSAFTHPTLILADDASESGTEIPFISIGSEGFKTLPKNYFFVQQNTSDRTDSTTVQIQRVVNSDDGHTNPKALRAYTLKNNSNDSTEWAISGELDNYSNTASSGDTAVSGVSNKYGTASVFAGHMQAKDWNIFAADTDVTALIGLEINTPAVGLDHPSGNNSTGYRRGIDVIARTNESVTNWNTAGGNDGDAEIGVGVMIRTDNVTDGYFRFGLIIDDISQSGNPNNIGTAALIRTSGDYGLRIKSDYAIAALTIETGNWFTLSDDETRKMRYGAGEDAFEFWNGGTRRFYFRLNASPAIYINDVQVVGTRDTGWTAMTGTPDESTAYATGTVTLAQLAGRVMALQTALTTHGLIGV